MRTTRRHVPSLLAVLALAAGLLVGAGGSARSEVPYCERPFPAAADGRLVLDRDVVRPGESVLGVLSGFRQWPTYPIGGGSGESFLSCTPWTPYGRAEVMPFHAAALFLVTPPRGAKPGTYTVSALFQPGTSASESTPAVRLTATLRVSSAARDPGTGPVCALAPARAPTGVLAGSSRAVPGGTLTLRLTGLVPTRLGVLNEYDRLRYVACLSGRATPVVALASPSSAFSVPVLRGISPGRHTVRVLGALDGRVVSWTHVVVVPARPSPSPSAATPTATPSHGSAVPTSSPSAVVPSATPSVSASPVAGPSERDTGLSRWVYPTSALAVAAAVALAWARRRRGA